MISGLFNFVVQTGEIVDLMLEKACKWAMIPNK